jgi:serine/threonine-protein kinase
VSSYDYYLKGRYHLHRRTAHDMALSVRCFEAAVAADEGSALAYSGMADAYCLQVDYGLLHPAEGVPKVKAAASRAIELDSSLAEAYPSLAVIRAHWDRDWVDAERLYRQAIALNPGYATAHHWLATDHLSPVGRLTEARSEIAIALELDPLSSIIHEGRASFSTLERRYDEAIQAYRQLAELDPTFYKAYTGMGRAQAQMGNYGEALALLQKGRTLGGDVPHILAAMGQIFAVSGDTDSARGVLAQLTARSLGGHVSSTCFALVHMGLGETEQALDWLEKGCAQHELPMAMVKVHPVYDPLRSQDRFHAIVRDMRFP